MRFNQLKSTSKTRQLLAVNDSPPRSECYLRPDRGSDRRPGECVTYCRTASRSQCGATPATAASIAAKTCLPLKTRTRARTGRRW